MNILTKIKLLLLKKIDNNICKKIYYKKSHYSIQHMNDKQIINYYFKAYFL